MKKFYHVLWTVLALLCFGQEISFAQCDGRRPDIYDFSPAERLELRRAMMDYLTDDIDVAGSFGIPELQYVNVAIHSGWNNIVQSSGQWHNGQEVGFLTWHRQYIQGMEDYLIGRGLTKYVPLPAWDNSTRIPNEFFNNLVSPGSAVLPASDGFPALVNQGPFGTGSSSFDPFMPMNCNNWFNINVMANSLEGSPHNSTHSSISGSMGNIRDASGSAIFWLFHSFVDEVYYCYQEECQGKTHDIFVREDENDNGDEPSSAEKVWVSPDIWVRNDNDGFDTDNRISETLCYKDSPTQGEKPVYVYVRVWNAGDMPNPDREGDIYAYWSHPDAGLVYPDAFDDIPSNICDLPTGGMIGSQPLRSVDEDIADIFDVNNDGSTTDIIKDYTIYEFEWIPPNPDDYEQCFDEVQHKHFCILARVDDGNPLVLTGSPGVDLKRNNNLALKNVTILGSNDEDHEDFEDCDDIVWVDPNPTPTDFSCLLFGNHTNKKIKNVQIKIDFLTNVDAMMLQSSQIYLKLEGDLATKWANGEVMSHHLAYECATNTVRVLSPNARFRIAQLQAKEVLRFCVSVQGDPAASLPPNLVGVKKSFDWDFEQYNQGVLAGGERYTLGTETFIPTASANGQVGTTQAGLNPFTCNVQIEQLSPCDFTYTTAGCAGPAIALWVDADGNQYAGDTLNNVIADGPLTLYLTNALGCQLGDATIFAMNCEIPLQDTLCNNINSSASGSGDWSDSFISNGNGVINLEFYSATVPDRLEVSVNGVEVVNSGEFSTFLCTTSYANCQGNVVPGCGSNYIVQVPVSYMDQIDIAVYGNTCQASGTYWSLDAACSSNFTNTAVASRSTLSGADDAHFGEALVNIFPNPASSMLNIEKKDINPYGVVITNALGVNMCDFSNKTGTLELDISNYPAGIYLVKIYDEIKKVQTVSKIVIQ